MPESVPARKRVMGSDYQIYDNPREEPVALPHEVTIMCVMGDSHLPPAAIVEAEFILQKSQWAGQSNYDLRNG